MGYFKERELADEFGRDLSEAAQFHEVPAPEDIELECALCFGSGQMSVPNGDDYDMEFCSCEAGQQLQAKFHNL